MPLKYFIAPNGKKLLVSECIEKSLLIDNYPTSYLRLCAQERKWTGKPSTTQLIKGTREAYLSLLTDYAIDPAKQAFRIHGHIAHQKLEHNISEKDYSEFKCDDNEITGILDLLEKNNGVWYLTDYKTWGSFRVAKAFGMEKKKRPMLDEKGNQIVYKKSGKWGEKGDPRMENYFDINPDIADTFDVELQLNRYRIIAEKLLNIKIEKMFAFVIVRDGNTITAKNRGIDKHTYNISIKFLDNDYINRYFFAKRNDLLFALDGIELDYIYKNDYKIEYENIIELNNNIFDINLIERNCPKKCNSQETWNDKKCDGYCNVADMCKWIQGEKTSLIIGE